MAANCCVTCGRAFKQSKKITPIPEGTTTASMTPEQIMAYYAATAPMEDLKFFLRCLPPGGLQQLAIALLATLESQGGKHSTATKREYKLLHELWRIQHTDRATPIEAIEDEEELADASGF